MQAKPLIFSTVILALLLCAIASGTQRRAAAESAQSRMRRLLSLPRAQAPLAAEVLQPQRTDGDVAIEDLRFRAEPDVWVPAMVVKPRAATQPLPAIICLPGTGGTRQQLADARLQLSERPRTGWARALARQGFLTISLDYRGSAERGQNIFTDAVREQLEGRSQISSLVYEVMRAVDYLLTRPEVGRARIGITGFSPRRREAVLARQS